MKFIVSGTDTGIGKTLLASAIMATDKRYDYWKPIQSGMSDGTDSETVRQQSACAPERIIPEAYIFSQPLSPHLAARLDGTTIDSRKLVVPDAAAVVIEGAGGLMVPLTEDLLFIDLFREWQLPVLLACRSALGTINHTLLSLEAMRTREIPILGCVFMGEPNPENERAIERFGVVHVLGRIPPLSEITAGNLRMVFDEHLRELGNIVLA